LAETTMIVEIQQSCILKRVRIPVELQGKESREGGVAERGWRRQMI